jgi:hypothetical protein
MGVLSHCLLLMRAVVVRLREAVAAAPSAIMLLAFSLNQIG